MKKILLLTFIGLIYITMASAYTADNYWEVELVLSDGYTADNYWEVELVLGEAPVTDCSITTDTTYTDEEVNCSGQTYSVSNSAAANFVNSNLTADNITIESGSKTINDITSILTIG